MIPTAVEPKNHSLPYALASIRRHSDLIPVTVGHETGLCDRHIATTQKPGRLHIFENTDQAMQAALDDLAAPFVWSADDVYWLHPATPIRWAIGRLEDATGTTVYAQRKRATAGFLKAHGFPTHDYESHTPLPITDLDAARQALTWCRDFPLLDKRSLYGNLTGQPDHMAPDVKIRSRREPIPDAAWASTTGDPMRHPTLATTLTT